MKEQRCTESSGWQDKQVTGDRQKQEIKILTREWERDEKKTKARNSQKTFTKPAKENVREGAQKGK